MTPAQPAEAGSESRGVANTPGYYEKPRLEMLQYLPDKYKTVLEIGCGQGEFAAHLRPGSEIWGVELNPEAARVASQKLHRVRAGRYEDVAGDLPANHYDVVICNDVIEHVADHGWFLESVKSKLTNSGSLVASIPNVRFWHNLWGLLVQRDWEYQDEGVLDRTHLRFFTEKSIKRTLSEHGFEIETMSGIQADIRLPLKVLVSLATILSLGLYRDIRYLQYGLRARKKTVGDSR
jgi:2-polyprenyl-3-methyl-5-hydroxy-6-metoxy-1,4-benzoquinol methylase